MAKHIVIKISPSGEVQAETEGIKGKRCTDYIAVLENILKAKVADSAYTPEYYEPEIQEERIVTKQQIGEVDGQ
jgi:hypothetical protein